MQTGLYVVGTPIGNMGDFSPRAIETLKSADLILCEDTRVSKKLLSHFGITAKLSVFAEYNERDALDGIIEQLNDGKAIAIITDSGMPGISDPGFRLVRACRTADLPVFVVPGPTAVTSALILSSFPTDKWTFLGFFKGEKELADDNRIRHTLIYYESPNRIMETIKSIARVMPERKIAIVREITKMYEETIIGFPADLIDMTPPRGELVLVISPAPDVKITDDEISGIVNEVVGLTTKDAAIEIAKRTGIPKKEAYKKVLNK